MRAATFFLGLALTLAAGPALADDKALTQLLEEHPHLDVQHLRTLIRNARKEQAENKPPKAYREIFQILKDLAKEPKAAAAEEPGDDEAEIDEPGH